MTTVVDTLTNMFTPSRAPVWEQALARRGVSSRIVRDADDGFAEPAEMVARMDELGIATLLVPTCDIGRHGRVDPIDFEHVAARWEEAEALVEAHPHRFGALAVIDPSTGQAGLRALRDRLAEPWVVGCYLHTHSWDRRFDHADYYPYYAAAGDADVPVAVQAGTSGGQLASECGHPIGVDRPALWFPDTRFVLSHTGWPWVHEAVAMALKHPNVFLGTGSYPPRHWDDALVRFVAGPGAGKVLFASNFPTVGHRRALAQVPALGLPEETVAAVLGGTAHRVFPRIAPTS